MPKKKDERTKQAFALYGKGEKLVSIAKQLNIPSGTVRRWKSEQKWDERLNKANVRKNGERSEHTGAPFGNLNALGGKGNKSASPPKGNKNALKHGLFSQFFSDGETKNIYEKLLNADPLEILWHNIIFQQSEIIRSQAIMDVKDKDDKTIEKIGYTDGTKTSGETWQVQEAWDKQGSYLKALSRAQAELRNMIKDYLELEGQSKADATQNAKDWKQAIIDIAARRAEQNESG